MSNFHFHFSLSTLNHLGRGLYRSFSTVIAEAISNSWDADATEVHVKINGDSLIIWDNGDGMDNKNFQNQFLKIGYSKRDDNLRITTKGRKVIGRKGIGKLSYLSISENITIHTLKKGKKLISAKISNNAIDAHIKKTDDTEKNGYKLETIKNPSGVNIKTSGTQLVFDKLNSHLHKKYICEHLAMHFHFANALKEGDNFSIYVNEEKIGIKHLKGLYEKIQFIWFIDKESEKKFDYDVKSANINIKNIKHRNIIGGDMVNDFNAWGFIASVLLPRDLIIPGSDNKFKAGIAMFAGGRMRETDILSQRSNAQIPESYLFGQIHIDKMDDEDQDCFTSSREGIREDYPLYIAFLNLLEKEVKKIIKKWDEFRRELRDNGDSENRTISKLERKIEELINLRIKNNKLSKSPTNKIMLDHLTMLARKNIGNYVDCFIFENMMRFLISESLSKDPTLLNHKTTQVDIKKLREADKVARTKGNIGFDKIIESLLNNTDVDFLTNETMAKIIDKIMGNQSDLSSLTVDIKNQKPIRNAIMHTHNITSDAKRHGETSWNNISNKISRHIKKSYKKPN